MTSARRRFLNPMRWLTLMFTGVSVLVVSCSEEKTEIVDMNVDGNTVPTMVTRDVVTMISDSGVTRYRITTPIWFVYDEAVEPLWRFPDGLFLEKFAPDFSTDATIVCDSATYFKNKGLWRLDGNVNILNTAGEKFLTQQVFWNQQEKKVYSDSFIHIERSDRIIEGYGFKSNERMTTYTVNRPSGIFPVSDFRGNRGDTVAADTTAAVAAAAPPSNAPSDTVAAIPPPVKQPAQTRVPHPRKMPTGNMKPVDDGNLIPLQPEKQP